jgi:hypothetical protein
VATAKATAALAELDLRCKKSFSSWYHKNKIQLIQKGAGKFSIYWVGYTRTQSKTGEGELKHRPTTKNKNIEIFRAEKWSKKKAAIRWKQAKILIENKQTGQKQGSIIGWLLSKF